MSLVIGRQEIEAIYEESPRDGFNYTVEVIAGKLRGTDTTLFPRLLTGVGSSQFPDSCDLTFYCPKTNFRFVELIKVAKQYGSCHISLVVTLGFHNWDLPESLGSFVDRYTETLKLDSAFSAVDQLRAEHGYDLTCKSYAVCSDDLFREIENLEQKLAAVYRSTLLPTQVTTGSSYGQDRHHWWIRYVVVPILCSGSVAGIIAYYLLQ